MACSASSPPPLDETAASLEQIRSDVQNTRIRLDEKKRARDVIWVECLNDKLVQIQTALEVAERSDVDLKNAIASHDSTNEAHARNMIDILRRRADEAAAEGENCVAYQR